MSKSRKPQVVKTAVIAATALGQSKSQIAEDLGITRNTVRRILSESEFTSLVDQGKSELYEAIPEAVRTYCTKIKADPFEAKEFLERITVLPTKSAEVAPNGGIVINHSIRFGDGQRDA